MFMQLFIKKVYPDAVVPQFAHHNDAGMDLYTRESVTILPGQRVQISTGIAMQIPDGYVGLMWDKSGLSHKGGLKTLGGVIDAGYRGEVFVGLCNLGDVAYSFEAGQKVAQLIIQKIEQPTLVVVEELEDSKRGTGAFGSTGA